MGQTAAEAMRDNEDNGTGDNGTIDLSGIGGALMRNQKWIIGSVLAAFLCSTAFVMLVKPRYTAEAKVLIENQESYFTRPDKNLPADSSLGPDPEAVLSQVQLMQSRDLARSAIRALHLEGLPEFDPDAGGGSLASRFMEMLGLSHALTDRSPEDRILDTYFLDLTVFPVPKSRVVSIEFVSNDRDMAPRAANTIADLYIDLQSRTKRDSAKQVAVSLDGLISGLKLHLAEAESRAEKFRLKSGLLVGANNLTITAQQLGDINTQLTQARASQAEAQAKFRLIRDMLRQGRLSEVPDVANNELVRKINEQLVTLRAQLALESRTLLPGHPHIKELSAQITDLENNLRSAADKVARTLENDSRIAGSRVENLSATLESQKKVAGLANSDDVTQRQYDSETRLLKEQLESNTAKYQEAIARQNAVSTPADARVVSRAVAPTLATFPKKLPIILLSTLAGLVFSAGSIIAGVMLADKPRNARYPLPVQVPSELEAAPAIVRPRRRISIAEPGFDTTGSESLVSATQPPADIIFDDRPDHAGALAQRIGPASASGQAVVTLVTSPAGLQTEAATIVSLARALAGRYRTILVNLDSHARDIDALAADGGREGLVNLLAGTSSFAEVIHRDAMTRLHILAHGNSAGELDTGLDDVFDALCETYDHVVLALPPVAETKLAMTLAPFADFVVLVSDEPASHAAEVAHIGLSGAGPAEVILVESSCPVMSARRTG